MKRLSLLLSILAAPAYAQAPQSIVLTPEEYQRIVGDLIHRDPSLSLLIGKQQEATKMAEQKAADLQKQLDAAKETHLSETPKP